MNHAHLLLQAVLNARKFRCAWINPIRLELACRQEQSGTESSQKQIGQIS